MPYHKREQLEKEVKTLLQGLPSGEDVVILTGSLKHIPTECSICFSDFSFKKEPAPELSSNQVTPAKLIASIGVDESPSLVSNASPIVKMDNIPQNLDPLSNLNPSTLEQLRNIKLLECSATDQGFKFYHKQCLTHCFLLKPQCPFCRMQGCHKILKTHNKAVTDLQKLSQNNGFGARFFSRVFNSNKAKKSQQN